MENFLGVKTKNGNKIANLVLERISFPKNNRS